MIVKAEQEKLEFVHRLEIRRLWLDKALIGVLILLAGFVANYVLEGYKSDLAKSQYLLDKRVAALTDMRATFSKLTEHAHEMIMASTRAKAYKPDAEAQKKIDEANKENVDEYWQELKNFINHGNEWGFLFSDNFIGEVNRYLWIHEAAASGSIVLTTEHQNFLDAISEAFDTATRSALAVEVFGKPQRVQAKYFQVYSWTPKEIHDKKPKTFFLENFEKWKKEAPP